VALCQHVGDVGISPTKAVGCDFSIRGCNPKFIISLLPHGSILWLLTAYFILFEIHRIQPTNMPHKYVLPYLPVALPANPIKNDIDTKFIADKFTQILNTLSDKNFKDDAVWRDHFAFTGSIRTFYGPSTIGKAFNETSKIVKPRNFIITKPGQIMRPGKFAWIDMHFNFETGGIPATTASGFLSVVPVDGEWKIWVLRTILEELKGHESVDRLEPSYSDRSGTNEMNGANDDTQDTSGDYSHSNGGKLHFDTVVIGGGQAGLCTGGRLKALGLSYLVVDKHAQTGDSWRTRYDSTRRKLRLHIYSPQFCFGTC
jgi:hypothetical protein